MAEYMLRTALEDAGLTDVSVESAGTSDGENRIPAGTTRRGASRGGLSGNGGSGWWLVSGG